MAVETGVLIFFSFVVLSLAYLSTNIGREHGALQVLCLIVFFIMSTAGLYLGVSFLPETNSRSMLTNIANGYVFVLFAAVGYMMLYYFQKAFELW